MIAANNPARKTWIEIPSDSDFPIQNIPFGVIQPVGQSPRLASRIGDFAVDLLRVSELGYFADLEIPVAVFQQKEINDFIALGKTKTREVRNRIAEVFDADNKKWNSREMQEHLLIPIEQVEVLMPVRVGDYTDFYSSIEHATNVGKMFRDPENALLPNWRHMPVGYHGRASSIVVSGTDIRRPYGQTRPNADEPPVYGPCKLLDFELEMGFVIGKENTLGTSVPIQEAEDHIFGLCLFNDWSARDIQKWEYVPLGPFLGKNFASTISPWIVTLDALEAFRVNGPKQDPEVLPYLQTQGTKNFDIQLEVILKTESGLEHTLSNSNFKYMYWNMAQQIAHHSVNGCNLRIGDMGASGTISGPEVGSYGSMLEICWQGTRPVELADGTERKFLKNGDTLILRGFGTANGIRIGFGEAKGKIVDTILA